MDGNNQQFNNYGQPVVQATKMPGMSAPGFTKWLIISIMQMMCCNQLTGIICLILVLMSDSDFKRGMFADYQGKMKTVKILTAIGVIFTFVILALYMILVGFSIIAEL